jgi:hypothetical protein
MSPQATVAKLAGAAAVAAVLVAGPMMAQPALAAAEAEAAYQQVMERSPEHTIAGYACSCCSLVPCATTGAHNH